jgi:hypothetical protein
MSFHDFLVFTDCVGKFAVIIMGLPLYATCLFSFAAFSILSLFSVLIVLIRICLGMFIFVLIV